MESPMAEHGKKKSTYSAVGHVKRNKADITSFQNTTIIT